MKKKKQNNKLKTLLIVLSIILIVFLSSFFIIKSQISTKKYEDNIQFTIDQGMYGKSVFDKLEKEGIIKNSKFAYLYSRFFSTVKADFKAGTFTIPKDLSLDDLIVLLSDDSSFHKETVILLFKEDDFITDFANRISLNTNLEYNDIIAYWNNEEIVRNYMNEYPFLTEEIFNENTKNLLEGYLFPSTYEFYVETTLDEITRKFLDQTLSIYIKYLDDFNNAPSFYHYYDGETKQATIHEIFTLASILQWESGNPDDMKDISSVFYNRLNAPEVLASTVTACYSFNLDKEACALYGDSYEYTQKFDNYTYNTYMMQGLPIGPVLCPGEDAIYATLHPNQTDYFYFIGDGKETHFARNWQEHQANIYRYLQ